jgi:hypothetical protein
MALLSLRAGTQVIGIQFIKTTSGQAQPAGCCFSFDLLCSESSEEVAD